jgi:tRNA pseudouridine38-40 synthase
MRVKFYFSYDGTAYCGWQRQKNTPDTIQEIFENNLAKVCNSKSTLIASGRTDTGVHAHVQVAHADVPESTNCVRLQKSLNSMLPPDIRIFKIEAARANFHAQFDVKKKTYIYFIDISSVQWPLLRNYAWSLRLPLDWRAMEKAAAFLPGKHDFKAFCASGANVKTTVRTIYEARWGVVKGSSLAPANLMALRLTASGFLKQMVRSIVGTLVLIGNRKAPPDLIEQVLISGNRKDAGPTAPPHGLWLWDVLY